MNNGITLLKELNSSVALLIQETNLTYEDLESDPTYFIHLLDKIPDYRKTGMIDYPLSNLLLISLILIMKGEFRSFYYASRYLEEYKEDFIKMGLILNDKVPSHDTFRRMFMLLDAQEVKECIINNLNNFLTKILNNYNSNNVELVSIDGKEFKGSGRSVDAATPKRNKNVFNIYNSSKELCVYSNPLDDKESEIKEAQQILNKFNLNNVVVTGDALHCQKETCKVIKNKKGNYVFTVKDNQKGLLQDIKTKFEKTQKIINISFNKCDYQIIKLPTSYLGLEFPGQKAYVKMVSNKRKNQNKNKQTELHFISSLTNENLIVEAIDNRWKIENDLHKTKDLIFVEDDYKFSNKNAIKVMACLNNIVYSFFRITAAFLKIESPTVTKIKFQKDPMKILGKISPLLNSREFNKLIRDNLKGRKSK